MTNWEEVAFRVAIAVAFVGPLMATGLGLPMDAAIAIAAIAAVAIFVIYALVQRRRTGHLPWRGGRRRNR